MKIFGKRINVMLDSGSQGCVISKPFLDRIGRQIEKSTKVIMIDIKGEKSKPLGEISEVLMEIDQDNWKQKMVVSASTC